MHPEDVVLARRRLVGVAAISLTQLGFELLFIKLSQYEFGSLSLCVVGLSMLGAALAHPLAHVLGDGVRATARAAVSLPIIALLAGIVLFSFRHAHTGGVATAERLLLGGVACLATIAVSTVPIYLEMRRSEVDGHRVYAASLVGGALGPPCALLAAQVVGDVGAYVAFIALASLTALSFVRPGIARWSVSVLGAAATVCATIGLRAADRAAHPMSIYAATNAFSRIDVQRASDGGLVFRTAGVNAATATAPPGSAARAFMRSSLEASPYWLAPARVLILGSGAGKNVVEALDLGARSVMAVEIDPMIPRHMRAVLPASRDPYRDPRVSLVIGEGREVAARFAAGRRQRAPGFDLVYVPVATLFGSSGTWLTETYLMTREAFENYFEALNPGGVVAVYFPDVARRKILRSIEEALVQRGSSGAIARMMSCSYRHHFVVIARPDRPFTAREQAILCTPRPGEVVIDVASELVHGTQGKPLEDDDPFLYTDGEPPSKLAAFGYLPWLLDAALLTSFLVLSLSVLLVTGGPGERLQALSAGCGFAIMGVAYVIVQTGFIQRLSFLLGHPVAGAAVVLPCTVSATGFGSWISRTWFARRFGTRRAASAALIVVSVLGMALVEPHWLVHPEWPWGFRVALASLFSAIPFVAMGTFFPVAFERAERSIPHLLGRLWLTNGVAAVLGSLLVIRGGMVVGFRGMLVAAAVLYAALAGWDVVSASRSRQAS